MVATAMAALPFTFGLLHLERRWLLLPPSKVAFSACTALPYATNMASNEAPIVASRDPNMAQPWPNKPWLLTRARPAGP